MSADPIARAQRRAEHARWRRRFVEFCLSSGGADAVVRQTRHSRRPEGARAPPHADPARCLHAGEPRELDDARRRSLRRSRKFHLSARADRRGLQHAAPARENHVHRLPRGNEVRVARHARTRACRPTRWPCFPMSRSCTYAVAGKGDPRFDGSGCRSKAADARRATSASGSARTTARPKRWRKKDANSMKRGHRHHHHDRRQRPVRGVLHLSGGDGGEAGLRRHAADGRTLHAGVLRLGFPESDLSGRACGTRSRSGMPSTLATLAIAFPLALVGHRYDFFGKPALGVLVLAPMILPPFVGAVGREADARRERRVQRAAHRHRPDGRRRCPTTGWRTGASRASC